MLFARHAPDKGKYELLAGRPRCAVCELYRHCSSPKLKPRGKGKKKILFISNFPTAGDDKAGAVFSGAAGREVREMVEAAGLDPLRDCAWTSALACRPTKAAPTAAQIGHCRPLLMQVIEDQNPVVIVPMGAIAVRSLIAPVWKESVGSIDQWVGHTIPMHKWDAWIAPLWSPGDFRDPRSNDVRKVLQTKYLLQALSLRKSRPWGEDGPPDFMSEVVVTMDGNKVASVIRKMISKGGTVAIDYETTTLKPHGKYAQIVSCAVCWNGEETIAFPWLPEVEQPVKDLLSSGLGIIAANIKFEETWGSFVLGTPMENPVWDTMQSAHVNRVTKGITSLKFQSFVEFGQPAYDDHIKPFLKGKRPNLPNRIRDIPLAELLRYNGMDALLEWRLAERQVSRYGRSFHV